MRIAAAVCSLILGLGFGIPGAIGAVHFARTHEVWTFLGFPTYGRGLFEKWGVETSTALIIGFVVVCLAEVALGVMILADAPGTKVFGIALLPFEFVYWVGFALPFGPPLGIARSVLLFL
jgi:hypothetical protein